MLKDRSKIVFSHMLDR